MTFRRFLIDLTLASPALIGPLWFISTMSGDGRATVASLVVQLMFVTPPILLLAAATGLPGVIVLGCLLALMIGNIGVPGVVAFAVWLTLVLIDGKSRRTLKRLLKSSEKTTHQFEREWARQQKLPRDDEPDGLMTVLELLIGITQSFAAIGGAAVGVAAGGVGLAGRAAKRGSSRYFRPAKGHRKYSPRPGSYS